ncbi:MAG: tetratricopeptide (TPR) repeat protein [Myxococcota bacterium]|jgi:tetratricopeptide (TPR) repeat protein
MGKTIMGRALLLGFFAMVVACAVSPDSARYAETMERHRADAETQRMAGELVEAEAILVRATALEMPAGSGPLALRQDAFFAHGRVLFERRRFDAAIQIADRALALGQEPTMFVANLYALRGLAQEALGNIQAAATDLEQAQVVHTVLFALALSEGTK